jgi:hypothetical protein
LPSHQGIPEIRSPQFTLSDKSGGRYALSVATMWIVSILKQPTQNQSVTRASHISALIDATLHQS